MRQPLLVRQPHLVRQYHLVRQPQFERKPLLGCVLHIVRLHQLARLSQLVMLSQQVMLPHLVTQPYLGWQLHLQSIPHLGTIVPFALTSVGSHHRGSSLLAKWFRRRACGACNYFQRTLPQHKLNLFYLVCYVTVLGYFFRDNDTRLGPTRVRVDLLLAQIRHMGYVLYNQFGFGMIYKVISYLKVLILHVIYIVLLFRVSTQFFYNSTIFYDIWWVLLHFDWVNC